jgi:hypothetical protein
MLDPFQPLTVGGTLRRIFQVLALRYDLFLGVFIYKIIQTLLRMRAIFFFTGSFFGQVVEEYILYMNFAIGYVAIMISMCHTTAELYVGRNPTLWASLDTLFGKWFTVVGVTILVCSGFIVCGIGFYAFRFVFLFLAGFTPIWVFFLCIPLLDGAWWVLFLFGNLPNMLLLPVVMFEGRGPIDSIKRGWELSYNNRCYLCCSYFAFMVPYYAVRGAILMAVERGVEPIHSVWVSSSGTLLFFPALICSALGSMYVGMRRTTAEWFPPPPLPADLSGQRS